MARRGSKGKQPTMFPRRWQRTLWCLCGVLWLSAPAETNADGPLFGGCQSSTERAGYPFSISRWARCRNEPQDSGYYVGGGAKRGGESRYFHEGTWGWDYTPRYSKVRLDWWHGRKSQGGEGQYEPDERNAPLSPLFQR